MGDAFRITFVSRAFQGLREQALSTKVLQILLDALYLIDCEWLKRHPELPGIYELASSSKLGFVPRPGKTLGPRGEWMRYAQEPLGQEDWKDIPSCLRDGYADCEDLACWRAAELTVRHGTPARPFATSKVKPDGALLYHIKVRYPDGSEEDPSRKLGMGANLFG